MHFTLYILLVVLGTIIGTLTVLGHLTEYPMSKYDRIYMCVMCVLCIGFGTICLYQGFN